MHSIGNPGLNRRALLGRGVALAGLSALAFPSLASAGYDEDLAEVRLVCATKRVTIGWYTRWIDAGVASATDQPLLRMLRRQEQEHFAFLSPLQDTADYLEVDWRAGKPVSTTSRYGVGYVRNRP